MKKFAGDIIILHMCTKNHNNLMYGSWDMECDRQKFLSLWTVFCSFSPFSRLWTQKIKIFKKKKKALEDIIILQVLPINESHMTYGFSDMECNRNNFLFWAVFCPFTPQPKKSIFEKLKKTCWRYHDFAQVYQKSWSSAIMFLKYDT